MSGNHPGGVLSALAARLFGIGWLMYLIWCGSRIALVIVLSLIVVGLELVNFTTPGRAPW